MDNQFLVNENKFWAIRIENVGGKFNLTIRYGRLEGLEEVGVKKVLKTFDNEQDAKDYEAEASELKRDKGYSQPIKRAVEDKENDTTKKKGQKQQQQAEKLGQKQDIKLKGDVKPDSIAQMTNDALTNKKNPVQKQPDVFLGKSGTKAITCMLAQTWNEDIDPKGYYLSEKLDGMRMIWTGTQMFSRNGNKIFFPPWFTAGWPKAYLDGELWYERDQFQKLVSITKKHVPEEAEWRKVKYMVFDAPELDLPFKDRYANFKQACEQSNEYIVHVPHIICTGYDHLIDELQSVQNKGGEGLMLREANSKYEQRRSNMLLKVKTFEDDEAVVIGHEEGSGRCQGMLGALKVRNSKGILFGIGSGFNDDQRRHPPKIGSTVTYKFYGVSKAGTPRFPIFLRERTD